MKKFINNFLIIFIFLIFIETIFKLLSGFKIVDYSYLRLIISTGIFSILFAIIYNYLSPKLSKIINSILMFTLTIYFIFQVSAKSFIGVYISVNAASQAGAITDYVIDYVKCIKPINYVLLIPFIILVLYYIFFYKENKEKLVKKDFVYIVGSFVLLCGMFYSTLVIPFMQNQNQLVSSNELYKRPNNGSIAIREFGVLNYLFVDVKSAIFPKDESKYSNSDVDAYISSKSEISSNEYTNYFKNKNLIVIMLESVNNIFINEEYYPNFYKLYSEGWNVTNNYSPRNTCSTGNNEFSGMTGLYSLQTGCTTNLYNSNAYSTSIFNLFNNKGYDTFSVHDYTDKYYDRHIFHKNMGSKAYYGVEELGIDYSDDYGIWPDDREMMKKVVEIIEDYDNNFMAWLTTVSTHQPYKKQDSFTNDYQTIIKEDYSYVTKAYMSKLKVLDEALGILLDGLEKQGKLSDTVIVLYSDHYPYGINTKYLNEVLNTDFSDEEVERTPFVIYNSEMSPKVINKYNSYINLTPTVANLFGLDYDSKNYVGKDIFSKNYENKVVFQDGSWKNEYAYYSSSSGKIKYYKDKVYSNNEIYKINKSIQKDIDMSRTIIKNNYFGK